VFAHYLPAVWDYIDGRRAEITSASQCTRDRPLHIEEADDVGVRYTEPARPHEGTRHRTRVSPDGAFRRRMVDTDGSSPVLFLSEYTAAPLAYDSLSNTIESARDFARAHIEPTFPTASRIHDLRHTYAVHLLMAIYHGAIAKNLRRTCGPCPTSKRTRSEAGARSWLLNCPGGASNAQASSRTTRGRRAERGSSALTGVGSATRGSGDSAGRSPRRSA
jgi:hypothetical protein